MIHLERNYENKMTHRSYFENLREGLKTESCPVFREKNVI